MIISPKYHKQKTQKFESYPLVSKSLGSSRRLNSLSSNHSKDDVSIIMETFRGTKMPRRRESSVLSTTKVK